MDFDSKISIPCGHELKYINKVESGKYKNEETYHYEEYEYWNHITVGSSPVESSGYKKFDVSGDLVESKGFENTF
ncbi:TPA: hypothetical protein ACMDXT_000080 [Vibrio parahaemolyticus]|nr:hypothetical protein [Vibrio parahaemolyticus]MBM4808231.1 hypothetical protein [Vibrio parahaemolyticus]